VSFAETRPDVVLHLASRVVGGRGLELVHSTLRHNLISAVNVMTAAVEQGTGRVVLAGSMEEPAIEAPAGTPASPYAAAKWAATRYALMFHALYELSVVSLRIFMVYGPGQEEPRLVPHVIRSLLRGEPPRLTSGTRPIDWVYIDDVVEAFLAASVADGVEGTALDVGSGDSITIRDLVETLRQMIGTDVQPDFGAVADRPLETTSTADVERTKALLGWKPQTTLDEGLLRTIEWCRVAAVEN
jgi:UDP-glucose 4-epimerase